MSQRLALAGLLTAALSVGAAAALAAPAPGATPTSAASATPSATPSTAPSTTPSVTPSTSPSATPSTSPTSNYPPGVTVGVILANGTGCPKNSAEVQLEGTTFAVTYPGLQAETGSGTPASGQRRNCQLVVGVNAPAGWTYALTESAYHGTVSLPDGASAVVRDTIYFQGSATTESFQKTVQGPYTGDYTMQFLRPVTSYVYAPCGEQRYLNINSEVRVTGASGRTATASIERSGDYKLIWRRCPGK